MISARGPDSASADDPGIDVRHPCFTSLARLPDKAPPNVSTYFVIIGGCDHRDVVPHFHETHVDQEP
jgi:hypothetical protein